MYLAGGAGSLPACYFPLSEPTFRMSQPNDDFPPREQDAARAVTDLPPVEAPSAGFIVQLFVIPAIVVFVVILVWLLFGKLAGGERDAMSYVEALRSPSASWRTAHELASLLQNDPKLSNDPQLLGELTDLLATDLLKNENPRLTTYLALAVGNFQTLDAKTLSGQKIDPLAILTDALSAKQPEAVRIAAATSFAKHAARLEGKLDDAGAIRALGEAAKNGEPPLRQMAVFALGFFGGDQAGELLRERLDDEDRFVRYNAACALARRDDPAAKVILRELLSAKDLNKVLEFPSESEKQNQVEFLELEALQALQKAVSRGHSVLARALRPELDELTRSGLIQVRTNAQALLRSEGLREPGSASGSSSTIAPSENSRDRSSR